MKHSPRAQTNRDLGHRQHGDACFRPKHRELVNSIPWRRRFVPARVRSPERSRSRAQSSARGRVKIDQFRYRLRLGDLARLPQVARRSPASGSCQTEKAELAAIGRCSSALSPGVQTRLSQLRAQLLGRFHYARHSVHEDMREDCRYPGRSGGSHVMRWKCPAK